MIRRSPRRLVLAALLVPFALVIGLRSAWALYACRMDGIVRTSCCCAKQHGKHHRPPSNEPRLAPAPCCDVTVQSPSSVPQVRDAERTSVPPPPAVVTRVAAAVPTGPSLRAIAIDRPTPRPPPVATFLLKQSFLR